MPYLEDASLGDSLSALRDCFKDRPGYIRVFVKTNKNSQAVERQKMTAN